MLHNNSQLEKHKTNKILLNKIEAGLNCILQGPKGDKGTKGDAVSIIAKAKTRNCAVNNKCKNIFT